MADLQEIADRQRAALIRRESGVMRRLTAAYVEAWARLQGTLKALTARIDDARRRGEEPSPSWLLRQEVLGVLERQLVAEVNRIAGMAGGAIAEEQAALIGLAQEHARDLVDAAMGTAPPGVSLTFARLPTSAFAELVGVLADGSPLASLLADLGPDAAREARKALTTGLALGESPRTIARRARSAFGGNLTRAMQVSRDATLGAYRRASHRSRLANSDVVKGWVWHAAVNQPGRTCAFCLSMHGSEHPIEEQFASHSRCRCAALPLTKTWAELGFDVPDAPQPFETGAQALARMPRADRRKVLGPAKLAAYEAGDLDLVDLRGFGRDRRWGRFGYERSLTAIVGAERARELIATSRSSG